MFDVPPSKIIYCYMEDQPIVDEMKSTLSDLIPIEDYLAERKSRNGLKIPRTLLSFLTT